MKKYRFEIARRTNNRYSWLFVEIKESRHRVLAYSARDYGSRGKAMKAIAVWKEAVPGADVFDVYGPHERDPFAASASNFEVDCSVQPLVVGESIIEHHPTAVRRRERKPDGPAKAEALPGQRTVQAKVSAARPTVQPEESAAQPTVQQEEVEATHERQARSARKRPSEGGGQQSS